MVGWINMKLGVQAGLGSGHIVLDGNPAPPPPKGHSPPVFGPCLLWPNGWMKTPLGTEVDLGPGHIVLDGDPALLARERGTAAPSFPRCFRPMSIVAKVAHLSYC